MATPKSNNWRSPVGPSPPPARSRPLSTTSAPLTLSSSTPDRPPSPPPSPAAPPPPPTSTPSPAPSSTTTSRSRPPSPPTPTRRRPRPHPDQHRRACVSGQKAADLRSLTAMFRDGAVSDASLFRLLSAAVRGVGVWSAHMFMIFALHRLDVLPTSHLGLRKGVQLLHGLEELPEQSEGERLCERWRPHRIVGAWYIWRLAEAKEAASP